MFLDAQTYKLQEKAIKLKAIQGANGTVHCQRVAINHLLIVNFKKKMKKFRGINISFM